MKKAFILYYNFYDKSGSFLLAGGVETYITHLIEILKIRNFEPIIIQSANNHFETFFNGAKVIGIRTTTSEPRKEIIDYCGKLIDNTHDIVIFGSTTINCDNSFKRAVSIQHGISWDIPQKTWYSKSLYYDTFAHAYKNLKIIKEINYVSHTVCVDNNFINWYRAQVSIPRVKLTFIPNCVKIDDLEFQKSFNIKPKIIFARRFEFYRGTRLFSKVIKQIIEKYKDIEVTFAGEGSDGQWLKNEFKTYDCVRFIKYSPEESVKIHLDYDIAVIPTIGSEGTSLSLLEAMAAKCAVITTNVGGMTNIILDNFNGKMISPNENELFQALTNLICDFETRKNIAENGYNTVKYSFNFKTWSKRWNEVFDYLENL